MSTIRSVVPVTKALYAENDLPSERLIRDRVALEAFTFELNSRVKNTFSPDDVAAELERIRKDKANTGGLPRLGRSFRGPKFKAS